MDRRAIAGGVLALGAAVWLVACAEPAAGPFTFRQAEFMPADQATAAARTFVADQLPPGLPLSTARDRLARAGAACDRPQSPEAPTVCAFTEVVHNEGGTLGEDRFTVRLTAAQGRLVSAAVDHVNIGTGNPNP